MRPHTVKGHTTIGLDHVHRVRKITVGLVRRTDEIINQNGSVDLLVPRVRSGLVLLVIVASVRAAVLAGVCLPDEHIKEVHAVPVLGMQVFQGRNSACGDRSGEAAEAHYHRLPTQRAQAHTIARGTWKFPIWGKLSRRNALAAYRPPQRPQQMLDVVMWVIILVNWLVVIARHRP